MAKPAASDRAATSRSKSSSILTASIAHRLRWLPSMACAIAAGLAFPQETRADFNWNGGTGDWFTGSNWTPAGPPTSVGFTTVDGGTAQINTSGAVADFLNVGDISTGTVQINSNGNLIVTDVTTVGLGATGTIAVSGTNAVFRASGITLGVSGSGTLTIASGGIVNTSLDLVLGKVSGSGTINLNTGGTLQTGEFGITIGTGTGTFNFAGGTLQVGNFGDLTTSVNMTLANATNSTVDTNGHNATLSGLLSGGGALTKIGAGTLTLSSGNTYSGGTTITGGTVVISDDSTLGNTSGGLTLNGGTLAGSLTGGVIFISRTITLGTNGGAITTIGNTGVSLDGLITGSGPLNLSSSIIGLSAIFLQGTVDNNFTGLTTIQNGFVELNAPGHIALSGDVQVNSGAILDINTNEQIADTATVTVNGELHFFSGTNVTETIGQLNGSGTIGSEGSPLGTLIVGGGTFSGRIVDSVLAGGTVALTKQGAGTLTLTGANTYTGGTTISGGVLQIGNGSNTGSIAGNVLDNASLVFDRSDNYTFAGNITGTGTVTQNGTGVLSLTGTGSNYAGGTAINSGVVAVNNSSALGTGNITMAGGELRGTANGVTLAPVFIHLNAGTTNTFSAAAGTTFTLNPISWDGATSQSLIFGSAGQTGTVVFSGSGSIITGSTSPAITVAYGTLRAGSSPTPNLAFFSYFAPSVTVNAGATLDINDQQAGLPTGTAFLIQDLEGAGTVKTGTSASTVFQIQSGNFSGGIQGAGQLVKLTTGTLALSGTNTYTGPTDIQAGTVQVDGSLTNSTVTVESGATLSGKGSAASGVTVLSGGNLNPGDGGVGTLTVGTLTLNAGANSNFALGAPGVIGGTTNALVKVNGNLTLGGNLNVTNAGSFGPGAYQLFQYGGSLTNNGLSLGTVPASYTASNFTVVTGVAHEIDLVVAPNAGAATIQYWDGAGPANNNQIDGGTGTWTNFGSNFTDSAGAANSVWQNGTAAFMTPSNGEAASTVTLSGAINFSGLMFGGGNYTIVSDGAAGTSFTAIGTPTNSTNIASISVSSNVTATIAAGISGTAGISKDGTGTLVLTGNNTFTGGTIVNAGTLQLGDGTAAAALIGATGAAGTPPSDGAGPGSNGAAGGNGGAGGVAVTVNSGATFNVLANATVTGGTGGMGSIGQTGGVNLSGQGLPGGPGGNGGQGGTAIIATSGASLSNAGTISGGMGGLGGYGGHGGPIVIPGPPGDGGSGGDGGTGVLFTGNGSFTNTGSVTGGNGGLGGPAITVPGGGPGGTQGTDGNGGIGVSFIAGGTLINSGTISGGTAGGAGAANGLGVSFTNAAGTFTNANGGVVNGGVSMDNFANSVTLETGSTINGDLNIGTSTSASLTLTGSGTATYSTSVTGTTSFSGSLTKNGTGTWTLDQAANYGGGTTINAGILAITSDSALGASTGGVTINGGTLQANTGLTTARTITLGSSGGTISASDNTQLILSGKITGAGALTLSSSTVGNADIVFTGTVDNDYAGLTTIDQGSVQLSAVGHIALPGNVQINSGGALIDATSEQIANTSTITNNGAFDFLTTANVTETINELDGNGIIQNLGTGGLGTLVVSQGSFSGSISDGTSGVALTKQGSFGSFLFLTGANTYSGPTTINGGVLFVDGSLGNTAVAVNNGGYLAGLGTIAGSVTLNNGGVIIPATVPTKGGIVLGTLTVGSLTWNGGGTLGVETDGKTTTLLALTGALNKGTAGTYGVEIVNTGSTLQTHYQLVTFGSENGFTASNFTLLDPGSLNGHFTLTSGELDYDVTGITTTGAIIQNSAPINTPTIADFIVEGKVTTGGPTENNQIHTLSFAPGGSLLIHNTLYVTQGPVILPGGSTITLDGSLSVSELKMLFGSLLNGNGNILGDLVNGGLVSPGHSPGQIHVSGNYMQSQTGTLQIQIAGRDLKQHDLLSVGGTATLGGALQIVPLDGFKLKRNEPITFLTAGAGVNGKFATVENGFTSDTILEPTVVYHSNSVDFEAVQGSFEKFADHAGLTPNQKSVAQALDSLPTNSRRTNSLLDYLDYRTLNKLPGDFDKIAPEELTSVFTIGISLANVQSQNIQRRNDDIRSGSGGFNAAGLALNSDGPSYSGSFFNQGVAGPNGNDDGKEMKETKTVTPEEARWGAFLSGTGEWVNVGNTDNARGYNLDSGGFTLGLDYKVTPNLAIGVAAGYTGTTADLADGGRVYANGGKIGLYATFFDYKQEKAAPTMSKDNKEALTPTYAVAQGLYADVAVFGGYNSYHTHRSALQDDATGDTDGGELNVLFGTGYDFKKGNLTFGPTASFNYTYIGTNAFTEHGSLAPLDIHGGKGESLRTALGFKASYDWRVGGIIIKPELRASWQHEYGDSAYALDSSFANGAGNSFLVNGPKLGRDSALLGAGFAIQLNERCSTYFYYDGELGRMNYQSTSVTGGLRLAF